MARDGSGLGKFIAGAAIGVGLGVLFAPKSGEETRKELKEKFEELVQKVKEIDMNDVRDSFLKKIDEIKAQLADLDREKVLEIAKDKAEAIKIKLDELVTAAKEKATPVIQKSVSDLRDKTIEVLKNTTKKLEAAKKEDKVAKIENSKKEK